MKKLFVVIGIVCLAACSRSRGKSDKIVEPSAEWSTPIGQVWKATTVPYDTPCGEHCEVVNEVKLAHFGLEVAIVHDPKVDDALSQWGTCLDSIFSCFKETQDLKACAAESTCPDPCKEQLATALADVDIVEAQVAALDAVMIDDGAVCRPVLQTQGATGATP